MYIVKKALNNNVLLVKDENQNEIIFVGAGIGYGTNCGSEFNSLNKVKQTFYFKDPANLRQYTKIVNKDIDTNVLEIIEEEIQKIKKENDKINENIHITLADHISFAIERLKAGIVFNNPFNEDIKTLYGKEYSYAEEIINRLNKVKNICLSPSETGIVALHINSAINNEKLEKVRLKQNLINEIITAIYKEFAMEQHSDSLSHRRILIHVKFAVERVLENKNIDNEMCSYIKKMYPEDYKKIKSAVFPVAKEYEIKIPDSELCYLVIHFRRVIKEEKTNGTYWL